MTDPTLAFADFCLATPDASPTGPAHDWHELVLPLDPGYRVEIPGQGILDGAVGSVFCFPTGCAHRPLLKRDLSIRFYLIAWHDGIDGLQSFRHLHVIDSQGRMTLTMRWLIDVWRRQSGGDPDTVRGLLLALLGEHRRLCTAGHSTGHLAERVAAWLRTDLHRPISLTELARGEGISVRQLQRRFKAEFGDTPGRVLQRLRLERARNLHAAGLTLKEIAPLVGYTSVSALADRLRRDPA